MTELTKALLQAHNTSPGLDRITYTMLRHLNPDSLTNILYLFNRVWKEHYYPSSWREAIVIPILKPGKVATDPLSYRPIALTSCFCKTFERMVNTRLVYVLEKENLISSLQSGFPVRYFNVRIGQSSSHKFIQDQGVSQGSVLSVTLFNIHMSNILHQLPPSVRGMLYVDDLQVSCQGSDMRLIERQLQTTVTRLVKWCDQNGHTISPFKSNCVHFCRKRNLHPDPSIHIGHIQIPVVSAVRFLGVIFDCKLTFLPHVLYLRKRCERSLNILKRLDTIHHSALRICSGAFRTSPVTSLYVVCHQPPLELRRRQLCANYFIRAMSVPSHPLKPFALAIGLNRLYEARSFHIKPFSERAKSVLNDAHINNINIQENNILAFPPWHIHIFNYHNPFSGYDKAGTADVIYQQLFFFSSHAELTAILIALQHILISNHRHFCVYTDSMSALDALHFLTERRHPTVIEILLLLQKLERKGFDIIFSSVPGYVGILGDLTTSAKNYIYRVWQETWDQQVLNKLHNIHPSTFHWAALPVRRDDVRLTRHRIGHTRFTHRHLLLGENAPECPS
ncbi:putative RNA-directed DNA polymerase from transposon X-element [Trichonephila clavipes]|uniref:Putative RNA-directed DNA polymerase from transposon X-element n=1 Tax=Trichonephila clavipes TaxID=2585209 RepID=A0A8X6UYW3_TRICX|nr:putative RNA-directed DNA polymerase from transposon X-element [Trichonephila clavipes]